MEISGSNLDIVQDAKLKTLENFAKTKNLSENQIVILKSFEKYLKEIFTLTPIVSTIPIMIKFKYQKGQLFTEQALYKKEI